MGSICCKYDRNYYRHNYRHNYNYEKIYKKCTKCGDNYDMEKNMTRTHCRYHRPNINNICIDCNCDLNYTSKNCYHIRKITFYDKLFG